MYTLHIYLNTNYHMTNNITHNCYITFYFLSHCDNNDIVNDYKQLPNNYLVLSHYKYFSIKVQTSL